MKIETVFKNEIYQLMEYIKLDTILALDKKVVKNNTHVLHMLKRRQYPSKEFESRTECMENKREWENISTTRTDCGKWKAKIHTTKERGRGEDKKVSRWL